MKATYVLKSIIINNLFGVDIMEEAVEICKLRFFLKLAAQVANVGTNRTAAGYRFQYTCWQLARWLHLIGCRSRCDGC